MTKKRLDELVNISRSQAKLLILQGEIRCNGKIIKKPGKLVDTNSKIEILSKNIYVSRGALKLEAAIKTFGISIANKIIADIGASTGGFTDYCIQHNAKKVYAIDVGHNQLSDTLKNNKKVYNMEGVNIKDIKSLPESCDISVVDLSFISVLKVFTNISKLTKEDIVILFKPQFESPPGYKNKNGIVKKRYLQKIVDRFIQETKHHNMIDYIKSPILGKQGNTEYLFHFKSYLTPLTRSKLQPI